MQSERVAFRTPVDTVKALQIGDIDFTATDASWTVGQVNEGRVRALAVTSGKRIQAMPNVPTMVEQGFPDIVIEPWWGVFVPAGTPAPIVDKLHAAFEKILALPETKDFLLRIANEPLPGSPDMLRDMLARDLAKWGEYLPPRQDRGAVTVLTRPRSKRDASRCGCAGHGRTVGFISSSPFPESSRPPPRWPPAARVRSPARRDRPSS